MTKYKYTALTIDGTPMSGAEEAVSVSAAQLALVGRGLRPLSLTEKKGVLQFELTRKRVPRKEVMHFSRQLGVFMKAGIPIIDALTVITEEAPNKAFLKVMVEMIEAIEAGDTFASAAAAHPEAFPPYFVGILNSAELTGNLDIVLNQLADYIERDTDARSRLISAMVYPGIVLGMSGVTVVVLSAFVLPRFQVFFKSLNAKLPLPTRILLGMAGLVSTYWFVIAAAFAGTVIGGIAMIRSKKGRAQLDAIILKLPVLGSVVQHSILERVCRILGSMVQAGVSLPDAMAVTADATNNAVYRRGLLTVRDEMIQGAGLAGPLSRTGLFPSAARQMFRVGEETGTLDEQLQTAAVYYDRELDYKIKKFTNLFEPAVIIVMGVVVGFVAVALVSAMYGIYKQVKV